MSEKEKITVKDHHGFNYDCEIEHHPNHGFTLARYRGSIIGDCSLGRILHPTSDDDREWERWQERFGEWKDEIKSNLIPVCQRYFNQQKL